MPGGFGYEMKGAVTPAPTTTRGSQRFTWEYLPNHQGHSHHQPRERTRIHYWWGAVLLLQQPPS